VKWLRSKPETQARRNRAWREIETIVGAGLYELPEFFRNGLYRLSRGGLADAEILLAYERCCAWMARAKNGVGECECGCGARLPVDAVNSQGQSVWHLDHDPHRKMFRGILAARCNHEIGDGNRMRKWAHASYAHANEMRWPECEITFLGSRDECQAAGAVLD